MKYSQLIAKLSADLEKNGDAEHVCICITVPSSDGTACRLDAVLTENGFEVNRDVNFANGLTCIVADYHGEHRLQVLS